MNKINASAAILIGGKSTRYGTDKAYLRLSDDPVSVHIYRMLVDVFPEVFFISGKKRKEMTNGVVVLKDLHPDIGPLGGLATALEHASHPACFLTACDLPFIDRNVIAKLWDQTRDFDITVPKWNGLLEPMVCFYHKRCLPEVHRAINTGNYMLQGFWENLRVRYVDMHAHYPVKTLNRLFFNINTQADFQQAMKLLHEQQTE